MDDNVISRILSKYGYVENILFPMEKGYRNESHPFRTKDGQTLNLVLYKNEPNSLSLIRNANRTADYAAHADLPARQTASTQIVKLQVGQWRKYGAIYNYLPGHTIPWEAYTKDHIKLLGKTLSDLHHALHALPPNGYPLVAEQYTRLIENTVMYFTQTGVQNALESKLSLRVDIDVLNRFKRILVACKSLQHQQVLHMDFVRSNILFSDSTTPEISGILDFEKTAIGHPFFDIARTLAFLLVDCKYKTGSQIRKYFLYSGYERRGKQKYHRVIIKNNHASYSLLEALIEMFLIYDFYKFLLHNPYESLSENEHFIRTKDVLLRHGLIHQC
jgi:Ser/Thr protein kinase RdoA (MazF antagonist)